MWYKCVIHTSQHSISYRLQSQSFIHLTFSHTFARTHTHTHTHIYIVHQFKTRLMQSFIQPFLSNPCDVNTNQNHSHDYPLRSILYQHRYQSFIKIGINGILIKSTFIILIRCSFIHTIYKTSTPYLKTNRFRRLFLDLLSIGWRGCASAMGAIKLPAFCSSPKFMCRSIHIV